MSVPPPLTGYDATAYHPELPSGEHKGRLALDGSSAHFVSAEGRQVSIPLVGAEIKRGGATGDLVQLVHPAHPGALFWTADTGLLKDGAILRHAHLARQIGRVKGRRNCCLGGCAIALLMFVGLIVAFVAMRETIVRIVTDKIPVSWEQKLGSITFAQVQATTKLIEDPELLEHLNQLAKPLLDAIPDDHKRYKFALHLAQDETPNAFAIPGGNIVVHSGLILKAGRAEEVAGVLAHEIAHITRRHSLQQLVNQAGVVALLQAVVGDVGGLAGVATEAGHYLLTQKYSRGFERDADEVGWDYLLRANIDPRGLTEFFKRLETEEGSGSSLSILSTHPATGERISFLQAKEKALRSRSHISMKEDFDALKTKLQARK